MKKVGRIAGIVFAALLWTNISYAGHTAGTFQLPFDPKQKWQACSSIGYKQPPDLYFMQLNSGKGRYHAAEDWNGVCGGSTDLGAPLFAIADGVVQNLEDSWSTSDSFGKLLLIRHTLPDGTQRDVLYEHILDIANNPRTGAKFKKEDAVRKGELIAHLGDGNGQYASAAHLHFEMRRDTSVGLKEPPYSNPLTTANALRYASPSLFIDDRSYPYEHALPGSSWTFIPWYFNAPSSTAFVEYNGERYSLQRAVNAGLIYRYVYVQVNGSWYYYPDITRVFFGAGNTYALWSFVSGAKLILFVPGDHFRADRARQDMVRSASRDSRFIDIKTETYGEYLGWAQDWELRYMAFSYSSAGRSGTIYFNQITLKSNPLVRYTSFYDPDARQWTAWTPVDWNMLD